MPLAVGTSGVAVDSMGSEGAGTEVAPRLSEGAAPMAPVVLAKTGGADGRPAWIDEAASAAEDAITDASSGGTAEPMVVPHAIICIIVIVETSVTVMAGATL